MGARNASVEKLRRLSAVEISIHVGRIVQDLDVSLGCRAPFDEIHQGARMRAQRVAVGVDSVEHDRGDWEHHAGRCEFSLRQNMMDQTAVETPVAVLERMDVDKTEGRRRRMEHGVELSLAHAFVSGNNSLHQWLADPAGARR